MERSPVEVALDCAASTALAAAIKGGGFLSLAPVAEAARPFAAALLAQKLSLPLLIVTDSLKAQEAYELGLIAFGITPLFYPAWESPPHTQQLPTMDVIADRLRVLKALRARNPSSTKPAIVASVQGLLQRTFRRDAFESLLVALHVGAEISPEILSERLVKLGYEHEAQVQGRGQFAVRGGIFDLFPLDEDTPVRIEFFGDSIDSLRRFDVATQISAERLESLIVSPAGEIGLLQQWQNSTLAEFASQREPGDLLEFLPKNTLILLDEPDRLAQVAGRYTAELPDDDRFHLPMSRLLAWPSVVALTDLVGETSLELTINSLDAYRPVLGASPEPGVAEEQRKKFFDQLKLWSEQDYSVFIYCNNEGERQRLREVLKLHHLDTQPWQLEIGSLAQGFVWPDAALAVVSDAEIFGRYRILRPRKLAKRLPQEIRRVAEISELEEGDFVVHIEHGIGRYLGLQEVDIGGIRQEAVTIEYAEGAKLYVPVNQAHLITRYVGAGKAVPPLSKLGTLSWRKSREAAEQATHDLAAELLEVQAARDALEGHAFKLDTPWQGEFEAAFIYEETPDQLTAIAEIKKDLESRKPMDRLLCGDVGYGKTEVAIRAAFKAVMEGRQVAVLVPTTVLAQQHFNTFCERMADYPVRVEMLSRFRTMRQQRKIIKTLQDGSLDIVIGTHRLLSADIKFHDLGLVVVDEEQRFGVGHKERLKQLRRMVDVLTLTATPIPRTLYLSLMGLRDMSSLETPPADRLPVQTTVCAYDERVIRDAIRRELGRNGQVYFLHNRVYDIEKVAQRLKTIVPEARVGIGHGQMDEDELEDVMRQFVNGDLDVLLCTTIIESGLDIPNANTIIIDRADRFGLADLYQLRGRVGRYKHQAYAYLMLPRHGHLFDTARKRISAIRQYSSLGSGFKIAMRDLEIRGAGNVLGKQQSGHITAVGFELYCQLLRESVGRLKGQQIKPRVEVRTRIDFLALTPAEAEIVPTNEDALEIGEPVKREECLLPLSYISDPRMRIELYRKIAQASSVEEVGSLRSELRDRFGRLPSAAELLLQLTTLKLFAGEVGVTSVETRGDKMMLSRGEDYIQFGGKFPRMTGRSAKKKLLEIHQILLEIHKATRQPVPA